MTLDFSVKVKFRVRMNDYVEKKIQTFPHKLKSADMVITPAGNNLFEHGNGKPLVKLQAEYFHMLVAKAIFLSKTVIPKIQSTIALLATRVRSPNIIDLNKLVNQ